MDNQCWAIAKISRTGRTRTYCDENAELSLPTNFWDVLIILGYLVGFWACPSISMHGSNIIIIIIIIIFIVTITITMSTVLSWYNMIHWLMLVTEHLYIYIHQMLHIRPAPFLAISTFPHFVWGALEQCPHSLPLKVVWGSQDGRKMDPGLWIWSIRPRDTG